MSRFEPLSFLLRSVLLSVELRFVLTVLPDTRRVASRTVSMTLGSQRTLEPVETRRGSALPPLALERIDSAPVDCLFLLGAAVDSVDRRFASSAMALETEPVLLLLLDRFSLFAVSLFDDDSCLGFSLSSPPRS